VIASLQSAICNRPSAIVIGPVKGVAQSGRVLP
jgi:hypothetical protein